MKTSTIPEVHDILKAFNLIKEGFCCPIDEGFVEPRVTYVSTVEIYCTSCSWRQELGVQASQNIIKIAEKVTSATP